MGTFTLSYSDEGKTKLPESVIYTRLNDHGREEIITLYLAGAGDRNSKIVYEKNVGTSSDVLSPQPFRLIPFTILHELWSDALQDANLPSDVESYSRAYLFMSLIAAWNDDSSSKIQQEQVNALLQELHVEPYLFLSIIAAVDNAF